MASLGRIFRGTFLAAARTLRTDQVNLGAIAVNSVVRSPQSIRAVIGDALRANGGHATPFTGLWAYIKNKRGGAGIQGVTENAGSRLNVVLTNFQTSDGEVIAAIDLSRLDPNTVYRLSDPAIRQPFLNTYGRITGYYDRLAGEGVTAIIGNIPADAVVGLARISKNLGEAAQRQIVQELLR